MNQVTRLYNISQKPVRRILGLMSGTSLDGLDMAVCDISGHGFETKLSLIYFQTFPYSEQIRGEIQEIFAKEQIRFSKLTTLHTTLATVFTNYLRQGLESAHIPMSSVDLIASHGQTVFHQPAQLHRDIYPATFQIVDGDHIAYQTNIFTLSDFRQKHVAAGGEGAPLAIYADRILFAHPTKNRILLNLGGIANFTFLPASESDGEAFTYDTGPANTLLDHFCQKYLGIPFDQNGHIAQSGTVIPELVHHLELHPYFTQPFPKSTGPETFHLAWVENCMQALQMTAIEQNFHHLLATLTQLTINSVTKELRTLYEKYGQIDVFISGGGAHNTYMTQGITNQLGQPIFYSNELGVPGDAKEAIMMAILANETICGQSSEHKLLKIKNFPEVSFGKISFPR